MKDLETDLKSVPVLTRSGHYEKAGADEKSQI